jgi:Uma2 family endonuclease
MTIEVSRYLFTIEQYDRMGEAGVFKEEDRIELIEGEIVYIPPIKSPHAGTVDQLANGFARHLLDRTIVRTQSPIRLGPYSEPQPDIALLKPRADYYKNTHPEPLDVMLIVEVADTTVRYDRETKIPMYARSGIPEVWLINLVDKCIEVYWEPSPTGYRQQTYYQRHQYISPQAYSDLQLALEDILG